MTTHPHVFWQCPLLDNLKINFTTANKVFDVEMVRDPLIAILGMKTVMIQRRTKMYLL